MEVLVGTNDLSSGTQYHKVSHFVIHQNFNVSQYRDDIAVAKINDQFKFNDRVQPIEYSREEAPDGSDVQLTG